MLSVTINILQVRRILNFELKFFKELSRTGSEYGRVKVSLNKSTELSN
jgi:hypothetical protein